MHTALLTAVLFMCAGCQFGGNGGDGSNGANGANGTNGTNGTIGDGGGNCPGTDPRSPNGIGVFGEREIDGQSVHGQAVRLVDVDGDGALDVVAAYSLTDSVHLYINGCESFSFVEIGPAGSIAASGVDAADFDGDGDIDVAAVAPFARNDGDPVVIWYENQGDSRTFTPHPLPAIGAARNITAADISGDGLADLVIGTVDFGPGIQWLRNTGGDFAARQDVDANIDGVHSLVVHDVDGDGALDVIAAGNDSGEVVWYESDRGGAAADAVTFAKHNIDTVSTPHGVAVGNFDSDSDMEVVGSHAGGIEVYDPPGDPTGAWTSSPVTDRFTRALQVYFAVGDLNDDGTDDIAIASGMDGAAAAYLRSGSSYTERDIATGYPGFNGLAGGDLDGDGDIDLVTSTFENQGGSDQLSWWENLPE